MKVVIIYDNTAYPLELTPDWFFSAIIEAHHRTILLISG